MTGGIGGLGATSIIPCETGGGESGGCGRSHAAVGFCSEDIGDPVILITTLGCADGASPVLITIDAATGDILPNGAVVPCAESGFTETNFAQICGEDGGVFRQLTEVVLTSSLDGSIISVTYIDAEGNVVVPGVTETLTVGDCYTPNLVAITEALNALELCCASSNAILTQIDDNTDGLEAQLATLIAQTDQIEGLLAKPTAFTHGANADIDSGANEQIVVGSNPAIVGVMIQSLATNTGIIYVGDSGVTIANGYPIRPGGETVIPIDNANKLYVISDTDNQQIRWFAI